MSWVERPNVSETRWEFGSGGDEPLGNEADRQSCRARPRSVRPLPLGPCQIREQVQPYHSCLDTGPLAMTARFRDIIAFRAREGIVLPHPPCMRLSRQRRGASPVSRSRNGRSVWETSMIPRDVHQELPGQTQDPLPVADVERERFGRDRAHSPPEAAAGRSLAHAARFGKLRQGSATACAASKRQSQTRA